MIRFSWARGDTLPLMGETGFMVWGFNLCRLRSKRAAGCGLPLWALFHTPGRWGKRVLNMSESTYMSKVKIEYTTLMGGTHYCY